MICPLSSVEPLKHSARPPILKHLIKVNNVTITTFSNRELLGWFPCSKVKMYQALSMKIKKCSEK